MNCTSCGQPNNRCNCESQVPFCDQCNEETNCVSKIDSECVIYHLFNDEPTRLLCLGLPNGTTVEHFMEVVDARICQIENEGPQYIFLDTESVNITQSGLNNHTVQADVNISDEPGNTITILPDGLFSAGGGTITCDALSVLFATDAGQKNTVNQLNYDFLVTGSAGCERVSPPLGFGVSGTSRKSAFGNVEFFATLTLANASAASGETVMLYVNSTENLTAKAGVNYQGFGTSRIVDFTCANVKTTLTNITITGTTLVSGTSDVIATNTIILGDATFSGSAIWRGGIFYDNSTRIVITNSASVSNIYSEKRVAMNSTSTLNDFQIVYLAATTTPGLDISKSTAGTLRVARGSVYAPNVTTGTSSGAFNVLCSTNGRVIIDSIVSESVASNGIYLQCGDQDVRASMTATNLNGRSVSAAGIKVAGSLTLGSTVNVIDMIVHDCVGFSETGNGIVTVNGNLKSCTAYSVDGVALLVGGSENPGTNLYLTECIAESFHNYAAFLGRDVYIVGGTYICRQDTSAGNPIRIDPSAATLDPTGLRNYVVIGVKTIAVNTTAYGISGAAGVILRATNNDFLNPNMASGVPGIDPSITLRGVINNDAQTGASSMSNRR